MVQHTSPSKEDPTDRSVLDEETSGGLQVLLKVLGVQILWEDGPESTDVVLPVH